MDFDCQFNKIDKILDVELESLKGVLNFANSLLKVENGTLTQILISKELDHEYIDDLIHLVEIIRENGANHYKDLIYHIVSSCLSQETVTLSTIVIQRLYKRGFSSNLLDSIVQYYYKVVKSNSDERFVYSISLGKNESSVLLCCNILKYLSKFLYVEECKGEFYICIDSYTHYNSIRRVLSLLFGSLLNHEKWNLNSLSNLFHPLSKSYLPCLILYLIIDLLPDDVKITLLESLSSFYSDSELMRTIHVNDVACLSGCISRLLVYSKPPLNYSYSTLSKLLTKGITSGFTTLDPTIRLSTLILAESYSLFLYNNSQINDKSILLKFDQEFKTHTPDTYSLASFKSQFVVNPDFSKMKENDQKVVEEERVKEEVKEDNESFLEFVFQGTPSINAKTVNGYVRDTFLQPPQHILQCYERLLSKPARGDVDYECLNFHSLDRAENETVEDKVLRVSQTLLYLPQVILKNEGILKRYSVPLSNILLKLDDLDLYREKIKEIADKMRNSSLVSDYGIQEPVKSVDFVSEEPEKLILVSLSLITYMCPLQLTEFYTSHLFDTEYTLSVRITMILCIQYTAMAFNTSMDPKMLTKRVLQDTQVLYENSISDLKTLNLRPRVNGEKQSDITLVPKNGTEITESSFKVSKAFVRNYNTKAITMLMGALSRFAKKKESQRAPMEEDIAVGIVETLIILSTSKSFEDRILTELKEMTSYFYNFPGQRLRNRIEVLSLIISDENSNLYLN